MQKHSKYEAAACIWWLELFPQVRDEAAIDNLDWSNLQSFAASYLAGAQDKAVSAVDFGVTVVCHMFKKDVECIDWSNGHPRNMSCLYPALLPVWGLLLAIAKSIKQDDWHARGRLVETSRSVQTKLELVSSSLDIAKLSINYSDLHRKNGLMADTFFSWLPKYAEAIAAYSGPQKNLVAWLKDNKIYNQDGGEVKDALVKAAKLLVTHIARHVLLIVFVQLCRIW